MALMESNMLPLGTKAPDFQLLDTVSGNTIGLQDVVGDNGDISIFICNHCPYVIHVNDELVRLANDYKSKGIGVVAISSNDVEHYPADSPEKMKLLAEEVGYPFPYCYDETQEVAKAYDAACTPDIYLFDKDQKLAYCGQLDGSRPHSGIPVTGEDIRRALDAVVKGETVQGLQRPSSGCSIKWKK